MLRNLVKRFTLANSFSSEVQKSSAKTGSSASGLTYYKDGQLATRTALTLKKQ